MSRKGGFPGGMGGFGGMNLGQLMKEAKKMQADMEKSQEELVSKEFEASSGGGAIEVKVTGAKELKEIKIKKDVVDPDDVEMLEDLILTCVNEALRKVDSAQAQSLGKYNIPRNNVINPARDISYHGSNDLRERCVPDSILNKIEKEHKNVILFTINRKTSRSI